MWNIDIYSRGFDFRVNINGDGIHMIINYILYNVNIGLCRRMKEFMGIKYNNQPNCTCGMVLVVKEGFHKCILF